MIFKQAKICFNDDDAPPLTFEDCDCVWVCERNIKRERETVGEGKEEREREARSENKPKFDLGH